MTIRLSGAQVTRIGEAMTRFRENSQSSCGPLHTATEEMAEDILKVVLPNETAYAKCVPGSVELPIPCDEPACTYPAEFIQNRRALCRVHRA